MAEPTIGIDLDSSARLLRAMQNGGDEFGLARVRLKDLAAVALPAHDLLGPVDAAREILTRHVRLLAEARRRLLSEDAPRGEPWMTAPSRDPRSELDAHAAAVDALATYRRGDITAAATLIRQWSNHQAFASTLIEDLGPDGIVDICWLAYSRGNFGGTGHNEYDDLLIGLTTALQRSFEAAGRLIDFEELYQAARGRDRRDFPMGPAQVTASLGMLFRYGLYYPPDFYVDATRRLVVDMNRLFLVTPVDQRASVLPPHDVRHLVLRSASRNTRAAMAIVEESDLADLAHAWFDYEDDGEAAGELLLKATRPDPDDIPETRMSLARRVIAMVADSEVELASGVHDILGLLAAPYISSFRERGQRDDAVSRVPAALDLDSETITGFLGTAMGSTPAARDLQKASAAWAWLEFNRLAADPHASPHAYTEVANGFATVTGAWEQRRLSDARRSDTRAAVAGFALDLMTGVIPIPTLDRIVSPSHVPAAAVATDSLAGVGWESVSQVVGDLVTGGTGNELELRRGQSRDHLGVRTLTVLLAAHALANQGRLDEMRDPPEQMTRGRTGDSLDTISPDDVDDMIKAVDDHLVSARSERVLVHIAAEVATELDEIDAES